MRLAAIHAAVGGDDPGAPFPQIIRRVRHCPPLVVPLSQMQIQSVKDRVRVLRIVCIDRTDSD